MVEAQELLILGSGGSNPPPSTSFLFIHIFLFLSSLPNLRKLGSFMGNYANGIAAYDQSMCYKFQVYNLEVRLLHSPQTDLTKLWFVKIIVQVFHNINFLLITTYKLNIHTITNFNNYLFAESRKYCIFVSRNVEIT